MRSYNKKYITRPRTFIRGNTVGVVYKEELNFYKEKVNKLQNKLRKYEEKEKFEITNADKHNELLIKYNTLLN